MNSQSEASEVAVLTERLAEARLRLRDIAMGCEVAMQPINGVPKHLRKFFEEIQRVARTPL
jgi:hypothetical protein